MDAGAVLLSLGHVAVRSADFDRTEHFYCEVLGLHPGPRPRITMPGRWYYVGGEAVVHVLPRSAQTPENAGRAVDHFAFNARNRPAFEQRLARAGVPFVPTRLADTDTWQLFLTDPDGARVELSFCERGGS
jgi:catechol 2,3-dioxygenase-like lactoylglutathione lyase family enzyme